MPDTTTTDQLTGLSPAVLNVYSQLVAFTEPALVDDIAQAAETPRSSTFKALVTLEERRLAARARGVQNGPSRRPDLWRATNAELSHPGESAAPKKPDQPTSDAAPADNPAADTTDLMLQPDESTAAPLPAQHTGSTEPPGLLTNSPDGTKRLAPGGLRRLVIDHLNTHPGEAFTATKISRTIGRSSGAITNALATLTRQGLAEQVSDRPRTYRAASHEPTT